MAIYHLSLKTISRSKGQSAIASSAYRSGERLKDEETGEIKDFTNKHGVAYSEVQLPENAPKEYQNRQVLWNAVQKKESKSNAQLAREVEVALPAELSRGQQIKLVHDYVQENFVNEGMCADWSIHDKEDGNPHAHIMLTTRSINSKGKWMAKQKSTYLLDENGDKIPQIDPKTGQQKIGAKGRKMWQRTTVATNNWNNRDNAEKWRVNWADSCNQYLAPEQQIDHRSYQRQQIQQIPTIHEGYVARQMGEKSERVQENKEIKANNQRLKALQVELEAIRQATQQLIQRLQEAIHERIEKSRFKRTNGRTGTIKSAEQSITATNAESQSQDHSRLEQIRGQAEQLGSQQQDIIKQQQNIVEGTKREESRERRFGETTRRLGSKIRALEEPIRERAKFDEWLTSEPAGEEINRGKLYDGLRNYAKKFGFRLLVAKDESTMNQADSRFDREEQTLFLNPKIPNGSDQQIMATINALAIASVNKPGDYQNSTEAKITGFKVARELGLKPKADIKGWSQEFEQLDKDKIQEIQHGMVKTIKPKVNKNRATIPVQPRSRSRRTRSR